MNRPRSGELLRTECSGSSTRRRSRCSAVMPLARRLDAADGDRSLAGRERDARSSGVLAARRASASHRSREATARTPRARRAAQCRRPPGRRTAVPGGIRAGRSRRPRREPLRNRPGSDRAASPTEARRLALGPRRHLAGAASSETLPAGLGQGNCELQSRRVTDRLEAGERVVILDRRTAVSDPRNRGLAASSRRRSRGAGASSVTPPQVAVSIAWPFAPWAAASARGDALRAQALRDRRSARPRATPSDSGPVRRLHDARSGRLHAAGRRSRPETRLFPDASSAC